MKTDKYPARAYYINPADITYDQANKSHTNCGLVLRYGMTGTIIPHHNNRKYYFYPDSDDGIYAFAVSRKDVYFGDL